ncbi:hypothetical protein BaRGS_00001988 [Batillaria attramentaria]|uniref:BZIP domain-containing protein n=1 Tax=Batillaria attramentaria TaxID=370345 RepID=A0ABD0M499_9CAEN
MAVWCGPSQLCPDPMGTLGAEEDQDQEEDLLFTNSDMEDEEDAEEETSLTQNDALPLDLDNALKGRSGSISMEVHTAMVEALASKSLTPILKEELRCKIQLKRLQHGQDEMTPDFTKKSSSMSLEEIVKRNKKMEQNRVSAHKSRQRQKNLEKTIQAKLEDLQKQNKWLQEQARLLRQACKQARDWLDQHKTCLYQTCTVGVPSCGSSISLPLVVTSFPDSCDVVPHRTSSPSLAGAQKITLPRR